ncbi:MAG: preprotein translocase subunit SecY [Chitinophagales bacterium]|nr:preprotein translocase subunit SecY [Chitinophagales bacterium]
MKKLIDSLKNIWKIEDLRYRIMITLGLIFIYRVGSFIVIPGVDPSGLEAIQAQGGKGLLGLINMFAGGAFANASIFALGIMPYISASIAVQLLTLAVPSFQKMQKEGESGRRKINQITRYLTVLVTAVQAYGYIQYLYSFGGNAIVQSVPPAIFQISTVIVLVTGTLFVMWIGEKITDKGIGNGISLIIMIGIIASLPSSLLQELSSRFVQGGLIMFLVEIAALIGVVIATILLIQGTRRIPVQYAKRSVMKGGRMMQQGGVRQYIPLKVNASGVMPIIFAQALMFLPSTIAQFVPGFEQNSQFLVAFNDITSVAYNASYFILVILFTYFYTALIINPIQMADDLKKNGGFIPGVKPGRRTSEFIDNVMSRITLPGSIFLGLVAILPAFAMKFNIDPSFALFYGGTSLLIIVGVVLDTLQQVESQLLMRRYEGLTKSGRIKGRAGVGASI